MIHFHPLTVASVRRETDDCVSIAFSIPEHLKEVFAFTPGQSLTIRTTLNGQELRRNYSICSSPQEGVLRVAVKKVAGGLFSTWVNEALKPGDVLEVMPPVGKFNTPLNPAQAKNYVAFAAGSGITPVLSLIKSTLDTEPQSTFTLVYGNRSITSIIFREELEAIKDRYLHRFRIYHILSREAMDSPLNNGRINREKTLFLLEKLIDVTSSHEFFLCGPEEMIFTVRDALLEKGVAPKQIHFELFTTPGQRKPSEIQNPTSEITNSAQSQIQVKLDGRSFRFSLAHSGQSILDAALAQGADLPFACKGGVCCTCKALLVEGQVQMDAHWGLEQEEIDAGFILTCQSHPVSETVVVDFDGK
ncbi:ring-1,2-phenylacetyl-CoA epoxidase subunit PaaE [Cnuella takakiae]|uniref:Ring-1,2-phenylacetyl-CoA epoxidase subunit PaaE n=1 Tax=Cnuella takakiae TaxID=1302690 RepID=A0A1M5H8G9_9BACT|nr:1,2-phenylacetyl-CoA epoxidase subunit PaaE [Cnuella takakiae]OLY91073.1 phenylacetic acid degradation protein [Cnuella takakiae]SHG12216.1 ring-1,2-phenylacetyl-CoA epoxidase subunit PaaE [Cnuella takakiae]